MSEEIVPVSTNVTSLMSYADIYGGEGKIIQYGGFTINTKDIKVRKGDPLGLGIVSRPPPPPDNYRWSREEEREKGTASLLSAAEFEHLDYLTIDDVRKIVRGNLTKESSTIDPELIVKLDQRITYKIFLVEGDVYTREELFEVHAFQELEQKPEDFFSQQLVGMFEEKSVKKPFGKFEDVPQRSFIAKDEDDETLEFVKLCDLLTLESKRKKDPDYEPPKPDKVFFTKVYVAKAEFADFINIERMYRTQIRMARKKAEQGNTNVPLLGALTF